MEIKQIKDLMSAMARTGTKRLSIKREGFELELERQDNGKIIEPLEELDEASLKERHVLQRTSAALSKGKEIPIAPLRFHPLANLRKRLPASMSPLPW